MTDKLRQAIEQVVAILGPEAPLCSGCVEEWAEALRILNDALAEQPAEPVAWMVTDIAGRRFLSRLVKPVVYEGETLIPLYPAPQPAKPAQAVVQVPPNNDLELLLRQVFAFCEATEDATEVEPKNEHQRGFDKGRRFEAKQIRRSIGDWFQAEFCGRSFMGEPVVDAAPEAPQPTKREPLTREEIFELAKPFGEFQYGDAQGHKRIDFAHAIIAAYERKNISNSQPPTKEITYRDWETDRKSTRLNSSH